VITGAGDRAFCAGWDLQEASELDEVGDYDAYRVGLYNSPGAFGYTRKADIFKPVIAAVNGYAFAAGLENALLADIRIASENAEFGAPGGGSTSRRRGRSGSSTRSSLRVGRWRGPSSSRRRSRSSPRARSAATRRAS